MLWVIGLLALTAFSAEIPPLTPEKKVQIADDLALVREQILKLETRIRQNKDTEKQAQTRLKSLKELLELHKREQRLAMSRMQDLTGFLSTLEERRSFVESKINSTKARLHEALIRTHVLSRQGAPTVLDPETEVLESPRRKAQAGIVSYYQKELEMLKIDLADAENLNLQIASEKSELSQLIDSLKERSSLYQFQNSLESESFKQEQAGRINQLQKYQELKLAQKRVEELMDQFNARRELEALMETRREVSKQMWLGKFEDLKGKLAFPIKGVVTSRFGKKIDPVSRLTVFQKGVQISADQNTDVQAIFYGKVVFSGDLPGYGKVLILDHGAQYYSLYAHLDSFEVSQGDLVNTRQVIARLGESTSQTMGKKLLYFELRSKNIAVNPLQWISGSITL